MKQNILVWLGVIILFLTYALMQADDVKHAELEAERKAEIIKTAKAEFERQKKWGLLEEKSEYMTFPVASYVEKERKRNEQNR